MTQEAIRLPGVGGRLPVVQKLVYELRYRQGYTYLDRCGRIINLIQKEHPKWTLGGDPNPQNASLVNIESGSTFKFSSTSLSLSLDQPLGGEPIPESDIQDFFSDADALTALVVDQVGLSVESYARIGFRVWYAFGAATREEAEAWLLDLGCYSVSDRLLAAYGGPREAVSVAVVVAGEDRMYRIGFNGAERQAQVDFGDAILSVQPRNLPRHQKETLLRQAKVRKRLLHSPEFVALIDIDAYQEDPQILDVRDFLTSGWKEGYERLRRGVGK